MTELPCTGIWDTMCFCIELYVTITEVVSLRDTFTDTIDISFQTRSTIQIRIPEVIPWECSLILRGTI